MYPFRLNTPKHRLDRAECEHYSSYKRTLREDFKNRCGYCDSLDLIRIKSYAIDHFVPQNPKDFTHSIKPNNYYNLIYACNYCNTYKSNKWPTKNPDEPNDGKFGFIKPTIDDYKSRFIRSKEGRILPLDTTDSVAQYIIDELKLWLPIHELMWKLEKLKSLNNDIRSALVNVTEPTLKTEIQAIHYQVLLMLDEIQDSILNENE